MQSFLKIEDLQPFNEGVKDHSKHIQHLPKVFYQDKKRNSTSKVLNEQKFDKKNFQNYIYHKKLEKGGPSPFSKILQMPLLQNKM